MTLKNDLSLFAVKPEELNPYEKHFLRGNPFPGSGDTEFDVCTDQKKIKNSFVSTLKEFSPDAKRLRINGKNGAGKTNILLYFERLTDEARRSRLIKNLYPIYIYAPGNSYDDIHGQIIDKLASLIGEMLKMLKSDRKKIDELSEKITPASELLAVIKLSTVNLFPHSNERYEDTFIRWLKGQKLSAKDRSFLNKERPPSDITSTSLAIRFLNGLIIVLKELGLCDGIILLFDEFEEIFEGLNRSHQSRYAQDLRHLFDMLKEFIFFVIATTPVPKDLAQYPAIERRLGDPMELQPIDSLELAIKYVSDYLESGRDKYETYSENNENQSNQIRPSDLRPLTKEIVKEEYELLKTDLDETELAVLPGHFLPCMRARVKQIIEG